MKNKEYWAERMSALTDAEINKGAEFYAKLQTKYNMAIAQMEKEISAWYTRYANENGITYTEAQKMLSGKELQKFRMSLQEFIAKAKSGNPEWQKQLDDAYARVRISRLESMKMQLQNVAESVSMDVDNGFRDVANAIYTDTYYRTAFETQKGIGMGYSFARVDESKVEKLISEPWASDGKNFSDRIWSNKNKLVNELQTTFTRDIITGASPQKTIAELSERMNVSKVAAGRLVMTESAFFASAATKDSFNALGVDKYEIVATLDSHTSAICQAMDGKVLPMKEYKEGATAPPFHVNCRSTTVPYFDDEFTDDEERASRDENDESYIPISADIKYPEWEERFVFNELNSRSGEGVAINEETINNVKDIKYTGRNNDESAKINSLQRELLRFSMTENQSNECAFIVGKDFGEATKIKGAKELMEFSPSVMSSINRIGNATVMHNHPNCSNFSMNDIRFMYENKGVQCLTLITNDGKISALTKTSDYDKIKVGRIMRTISEKMGDNPSEKVLDKYTDKLIEILDKKGMIKWDK